ncbi:MAG TPA: diacylglycerol kinase family protein [Bryobacteraceae bacterium]|nr:diacylglycerol kinase family protein [Bryobacteraceae bacterium]
MGSLPPARYENAYLIYNPQAGRFTRGRAQLLQRIIQCLAKRGHHVTPVGTTGPGVAASVARDAIAGGADLILAAGGDGTLNEVLNGAAHSDVPVGIIPAGTANVLGAELRIAGGPVGAAGDLHNWVPRRIALGLLRNEANPQGRYFALMAGAGLDAKIVYEIDAGIKARFGKGAYWLAGFGQLGRRFPEFQARTDGHIFQCSFALASRVRNYGGDIEIARGASLFADVFETVLFEGAQSWVYLRYFLGVLTASLDKVKGVTMLQTRELEFECASDPRIYIQVDGEYAGNLPAHIEVVPHAVTLLVPERFARRHG